MMKRFLLLSTLFIAVSGIFANQVLYFWSGGITEKSGRVNAVLKMPAEKVRLMVSTTPSFVNPQFSSYASATTEHGNTVSLEITGLGSGTRYYYCFEIDGNPDKSEKHSGSFQTYVNGPFTFRFVAGSCNFFPNNRVYDKMRMQNPLFLMMPGDLHYANPSSSDVEPHRDAYEQKVLQQPRESRFLKDIPIAYVWDDHDFCGDNNDGTSGCGLAAYQAYTEYVPHYPFGAPEGSHSIYQAFTVGRVRFIMSDLRSERREGDIMGPDQKNWFKNEIVTARDNGQMICWVSSVSFSGTRSDNWGAYTESRKELSNFLRDSNITNFFIISGDAHMLAVDNGTHADFSDGNNNPNLYPILQSAALNNVGSDKGGEYSEGGTFPNPAFSSQWSTIDVTDNGGDDICIQFTCYRMDLVTKKVKVLINYEFCRTLTGLYTPIFTNTKPMVISKTSDSKLSIEVDYSGKANVRLLDYKGKRIIDNPGVEIAKNYQLDVTNLLSKGIHYVIVETDGGKYIGKIDLPG